jgi:tetratricopeptide (TPR) repeat protein
MFRSWRTVAAVVLLAAACTSSEERAARHLEHGEYYLDQDEVKAALLEFQSALKLRPGNAALYEQIGDVLFERNRAFLEALAYYQEAYRLDPSRIHSAMREARLIALEKPTRARELVDRALEQEADLPIVQRALSHVALIEGDLTTALAAARQAVLLEPDSPPNWAQLGSVHVARISARQSRGLPPSQATFRAAIAAFQKVDETKHGSSPRAWLETARVYGFWGRRTEAQDSFRKAIELAKQQGSPAEIRFAARIADEYGRNSRNPSFRRYALRELVASDEDAYDAWNELARVVDQLPDRSGEEIYLELLAKRPKDVRAHLLYTAHLVRKERRDDAEAHLRRSIDDGLNDPRLGEGLVRLALRRGDLTDARAAYVEMSDEFPDAFATRLAEARIILAEGRGDEAARRLGPLVAEQESHELQRLLALAHFTRGDQRGARRAIERAEALSPVTQFAVLRLRARIDASTERWKPSLEAYQTLLESGQILTKAERVGYATALYQTGSNEAGRRVLVEMISGRNAFPGAAVAYARFEGERHPVHAKQVLTKAQRRHRTHVEVLEVLTRLEVAEGEGEKALQRLNRLVEDRLAGPDALLLRAEILASRGDYESAEADVLRAFEANPGLPGAVDLLHSLYRVQGKLEEAQRSFEQAEKAGVLHAGARLLLARLYLDDGNPQQARETLERVVAEAPELWTGKRDLSLLLSEQGENLDRALVLAGEASDAAGGDPSAVDAMGAVLLASGQPEAALQAFDRAIRRADARPGPASPTIHYHRGLALRALGREEQAAQALQQALGQGEFPQAEDARQQLEAARHSEVGPGSSS